MAFEPGGYADKLGNRHEGRWVVRQLLRLLDEEILSVTIEAIGDDQQGVDLWIQRSDGTRQAQQCKARNASKESWTIADLNARGILAAMRYHLDRSEVYQFALVTGVPVSVLGDICESARNSNGNPEDFYQYQIKEIGEERRKAFRQFCQYLDLDSERPPDLAAAFSYLQRSYVHLWPDDRNSRDELLSWAGILATGEPEAIVSFLADFAQTHLRRTLNANDIRTSLSSLGFHPRRLSQDTRVMPSIVELQSQFEESIAPHLIAGEMIVRPETKEVFEASKDGGIVILHGAAGYGKSGVLYELTRILRENGYAYLPIRLDRKNPRNTIKQFGEDLGLPESPTLCLESISSGQLGVLILDQLDVLRWTSSHSANSLDVCKALVREVRTLRDQGRQIAVVLACRTFDLEHDPEIKSWLKDTPGRTCRRVEVKGLPDETIKGVVERFGRDFSVIAERQKKILRSPQHLGMWVEIVRTGGITDFQSTAQLMRQFWDNRHRELEKSGISLAQADAVLDPLTQFMEQRGNSAPRSIVEGHPAEVDALHSLGIIQTTGSQVSFCHQSYLDFRIASRLLDEIYRGQGSIRAWLGPKAQQSLFRREQLRLALSLLIEESPADFLGCVRDMLSDPGVRFHIKHLVLELIGSTGELSNLLCNFIAILLGDEFWREHILETVFHAQPHHVQWLIERGIISEWLASSDTDQLNRALWLLRSVAEKLPDGVAFVLEPYADHDKEWMHRVLNSLCTSGENDSDGMFELRLKLARCGVLNHWIHWRNLASKYPVRIVQLIEAVSSTWSSKDFEDLDRVSMHGRRGRFELLHVEDVQALKTVASKHAQCVWDNLMHHVDCLTASGTGRRILDAWQDGGSYRTHGGETSIRKCMVEMVIEAGMSLAQQDPKLLLERTRPLHNSISPVTRLIIVEAYSVLPAAFADEAIRWFMGDPLNMSLGSGYGESEWMPAARLIKALSPHCSEQTFEHLEKAIIHYHSPDEKRMAEYCLPVSREGIFCAYWGKAQYILLPVLAPERRSPEASRLVSVLGRKFGQYPDHRFLRGGASSGGSVVSSIPPERLDKIGDHAWLKIVGNKKIPKEHGGRWRQIDKERVAESSIRHFAHDLRRMAKWFPDRFGRLALQFPEDADPAYIASVLEGLKQTEPPSDLPEGQKASWSLASIKTIEALLEKLPPGENQSAATAFCWLIEKRPDEPWSEGAIDKLIWYATSHPDLEPGKLNVNCDKTSDEASTDILYENTINCVRGVAAHSIGALLWSRPDLLPRLQPTIEALISDPHPVVRMASLDPCLPIINTNKELAVEFFQRAARDDLRIAASPNAVHFFNTAVQSHFNVLAPLVHRMLQSDYDDVVQKGAEEITARWLFYGVFADELDLCRTGSVPKRRGVAHVASHFVSDPEYSVRCQALIIPLLDDSDAGVRDQTRKAFGNPDVLLVPESSAFIRDYVHSRCFRDDPSPLLYILKDFSGSLLLYADLIFQICEVFSGSLREQSRDFSGGIAGDAHLIPPLLLRLYEQAQECSERDTADSCLDTWDMLFENRVGMTRDLTSAIQQ